MAVAAASAAVHHPIDHPEHFGILKQFSDVSVDGTYKHGYETEDGISAHEEGVGGVHAEGGASYTSPEGIPVVLSYSADKDGFHPTGSHVHPVPELIARSLHYIATHPAYVDPVVKSHH